MKFVDAHRGRKKRGYLVTYGTTWHILLQSRESPTQNLLKTSSTPYLGTQLLKQQLYHTTVHILVKIKPRSLFPIRGHVDEDDRVRHEHRSSQHVSRQPQVSRRHRGQREIGRRNLFPENRIRSLSGNCPGYQGSWNQNWSTSGGNCAHKKKPILFCIFCNCNNINQWLRHLNFLKGNLRIF